MKFDELRKELARLQQEYQDDGRYADPETWPKGLRRPLRRKQPMGLRSVSQAIAASRAK